MPTPSKTATAPIINPNVISYDAIQNLLEGPQKEAFKFGRRLGKMEGQGLTLAAQQTARPITTNKTQTTTQTAKAKTNGSAMRKPVTAAQKGRAAARA
jgi:hypothetical protein